MSSFRAQKLARKVEELVAIDFVSAFAPHFVKTTLISSFEPGTHHNKGRAQSMHSTLSLENVVSEKKA